MQTSQIAERLRKGSHLSRWADQEFATASNFDHPENVILIHGFTATGKYLSVLAEQLAGHGSNCFFFNYDSLTGIDAAAESLMTLFEKFDRLSRGKLRERKVTLVCHSMGGIVARALCYLPRAEDFVKAIVTMGTPHGGTLCGDSHLKLLVKWGESISRAMPGYVANTCVSAAQLIGADDNGKGPLLDTLRQENSVLTRIPCLSISGGKRWLEFGLNSVMTAVANNRLQKLMGNEDNDGLVPEKSSDITGLPETCRGAASSHDNSYSEYLKTNHSSLIANHQIALTIAVWLAELQPIQPAVAGESG